MPATETKPELTLDKINPTVNAILEILGNPESDLHQKTLSAFQAGHHDQVKWLAASHLNDTFCKSLSYLGGALKLGPTTATILAESARAAADFAAERTRQQTMSQLGYEISKIVS
ncbi:hypothetical protein ACQ4M3_13345 [Leptolyngbya sp. AN03gr2]|uniref:hypothetical protein n=1 Tax=unclassified Leptolyngbya TaxID=2650499 RepID=UPI003D318AB8